MDPGSRELWIQKANMEPSIGWGLSLGLFCQLKWDFLHLKRIHRLKKHDSWPQLLHGSRIPRNVDPESEHGTKYRVGMSLGMFCRLKLGFLHLKLIHRLEKHDSWPQRLHRSRIPRTVDPGSEHGSWNRVRCGSMSVLPIEMGFSAS